VPDGTAKVPTESSIDTAFLALGTSCWKKDLRVEVNERAGGL